MTTGRQRVEDGRLFNALFDLSVGWPRQTYFELRQRPIQRGEHDVVSPVRFGHAPHPSRTAPNLIINRILLNILSVNLRKLCWKRYLPVFFSLFSAVLDPNLRVIGI